MRSIRQGQSEARSGRGNNARPDAPKAMRGLGTESGLQEKGSSKCGYEIEYFLRVAGNFDGAPFLS